MREPRRNGGRIREVQLQMFRRDRIASRNPFIDCFYSQYSAVRERGSSDVGRRQVGQLLADLLVDLF